MGLSSKEGSSKGLDWAQKMLEEASTAAPVVLEIPNSPSPQLLRRQQQQQQQQSPVLPLKCPRCSSSNTKFCYFNNYNRSQPRHFCKSCRRHWTQGGTLRNVPVGGGRKNKRLIKTTTATNSNNSNSNSSNSTSTVHNNSSSSSCSSSSSAEDQQQPWLRGGFEVPQEDCMNYSLNDDENMINLVDSAPSLLPLPSFFPFTSSGFLGNSSSLISSFPGQFTSSDSYNCISTTNSTITTATTATTTASNASTDYLSYWSWDSLDSLISTDLKLPWEDFQSQELGI